MTRKINLARLAVFLVIASTATGAEVLKLESRGPLKRFDPNAVKIEAVVAVYGDPTAGAVSKPLNRAQRLSNEDKWFLGMGSVIGVMGLDSKTGQIGMKEVIEAGTEWSVSPDGSNLFASRKEAYQKGKYGKDVFECFDLASGASRWVFNGGSEVYDSCFSPDGKQVAILHTGAISREAVPSSVSWYDVQSGERVRQVALPGSLRRLSGGSSERLAFSGTALYVTRPSESDGKCFVIKNGAESAEPIDLGNEDPEETPSVRTGGPNNELVAIYTDLIVHLYRENEGRLVHLSDVETVPKTQWAYENNVRFSPDGTSMLVSTSGRTTIVPTVAAPEAKTIEMTKDLGEYTRDGKNFVFFDNGGGWIFRTKDWVQVERPLVKDHPVHCCPIEDADFSKNGKLVLSNDKQQLLLWSEDGKLLAELSSPQEKDGITCVEMQSAIFLPGGDKIYAADGWNFLEWDLYEVSARVKRKPINTPRVVGKIVLDSASGYRAKPVLMNVALDSTGKNLVTASGPIVRYWPLASKETPPPLLVPKSDIMMRPRFFHKIEARDGIILRSAGSTFMLSLDGKSPPVELNTNATALDLSTESLYYANRTAYGTKIQKFPLFPVGNKTEEIMELPEEWFTDLREIPMSQDGNLLAILHGESQKLSSLALIDWKQKKIVYNQELPWTVTSCRFSPDDTKLIVGSHNRAVYVFNLSKMSGEGG